MGRLRDLLNGGASPAPAPAPVVEAAPEPTPVVESEAPAEVAEEETSEETE